MTHLWKSSYDAFEDQVQRIQAWLQAKAADGYIIQADPNTRERSRLRSLLQDRGMLGKVSRRAEYWPNRWLEHLGKLVRPATIFLRLDTCWSKRGRLVRPRNRRSEGLRSRRGTSARLLIVGSILSAQPRSSQSRSPARRFQLMLWRRRFPQFAIARLARSRSLRWAFDCLARHGGAVVGAEEGQGNIIGESRHCT
jgi:hypothetical protein